MTIHNALRIHREATGISQNELHRRSGIPQNTISYWESGGGCPTVNDCLQLAKGLGITLGELLADIDQET